MVHYFIMSLTAPQDAPKRLVLQVYLGSTLKVKWYIGRTLHLLVGFTKTMLLSYSRKLYLLFQYVSWEQLETGHFLGLLRIQCDLSSEKKTILALFKQQSVFIM